MMRSVLAWFVFASSMGAAPVLAQQAAVEWNEARRQGIEAARRDLRSDIPKDIAWGAFRAAEYRLRDLVPDLASVLESPPSAEPFERHALIASLLDAAVQLNADIPPAIIRRYWIDWPVHTALLMTYATSPDRDGTLLDLLPLSEGFQWPAAANLLLTTKPAGFAAALLSKLQLELSIGVADLSEQGRMGVVAGGGIPGVAVGDGVGVNPPRFPPFAAYRFESDPSTGHIVLTSGPRTVYYSRNVTYQYQFGISQIFGSANRLDYLAALANLTNSETVRRLLRPSVSVTWRGTDEFNRDVSHARTDVTRNYQQVLSALVRLKHLTDQEAQQFSSLDIRVRLIDVRTDKSEPLPSVQ